MFKSSILLPPFFVVPSITHGLAAAKEAAPREFFETALLEERICVWMEGNELSVDCSRVHICLVHPCDL